MADDGIRAFAGTSLVLGPWWGLALAPLIALLLGVRIGIEEKTLRMGLEGHDDYAACVGVWFCSSGDDTIAPGDQLRLTEASKRAIMVAPNRVETSKSRGDENDQEDVRSA
jgi:hypothetical protein